MIQVYLFRFITDGRILYGMLTSQQRYYTACGYFLKEILQLRFPNLMDRPRRWLLTLQSPNQWWLLEHWRNLYGSMVWYTKEDTVQILWWEIR